MKSNLEKCVMCGVETYVDKDTHIDLRDYYVAGVGQLCVQCYFKVNEKEDEE